MSESTSRKAPYLVVVPAWLSMESDSAAPGLIVLSAATSLHAYEDDEASTSHDPCLGVVDLDDEWTPYDVYLESAEGGGFLPPDLLLQNMMVNLLASELTSS